LRVALDNVCCAQSNSCFSGNISPRKSVVVFCAVVLGHVGSFSMLRSFSMVEFELGLRCNLRVVAPEIALCRV